MWHYRTKSWDKWNHIDPDVHADLWYKNGIGRSRNAWAMSAWKRRTSFAPTQGLLISGYVASRHRYCNSHISSYEWKIWIITTRQLRVYVTLFFPYFSHPYFIKAMEAHIGQQFHKLLKCKPSVGAKLILRFQALITHTFIDRSILFCSANRHVHPDLYPENEYNFSQGLVQ